MALDSIYGKGSHKIKNTEHDTNQNITDNNLNTSDTEIDENHRTINSNIALAIRKNLDHITDFNVNGKYSLEDLENAMFGESKPLGEYKNIDKDGDFTMMDIDKDEDIKFVSQIIRNQRANSNFMAQLTRSRSNSLYDYSNDMINPSVTPVPYNSIQSSTRSTIFVVDTNFIISHLNTLEGLRTLSEQYHHTIMIPMTVVKELDGLKHSEKIVKHLKEQKRSNSHDDEEERAVGQLARWANSWIYKNLANRDSGIAVQRHSEKLDKTCIKDDAILDCCLFFNQESSPFSLVVLLSNDKNLCLRALGEDILTISFTKTMNSKLIASTTYQEFLTRQQKYQTSLSTNSTIINSPLINNNILIPQPNCAGTAPHNNSESQCHIEQQFQNTQQAQYQIPVDFVQATNYIFEQTQSYLIYAINSIMFDSYGDDLSLLDYNVDSITTITDCVNILYKYWSSVFSEFFKNTQIHQDSWTEFPSQLSYIPTTPNILQIFLKFWSNILKILYSPSDLQYRDTISTEIQKWHEISLLFTNPN
ncbi:hypothetical protein TBLA_0G00480 [Henningerozyma blattae CBS 6284]|uniref:Transcriptional protein SWT1 n=1 Tax=Henningerozyma blattae (strain ATCC 34711 / CBS 6284 / DSM 70876 / NBRC 10599 / NRRL Y-10934 / UCD 77-7) TaxID=1071380 RepID=I2H6J5_HENB6|nr:hypothetical protein TBLA_0G00480 [Tetrapisispora blattae CBS 6284]CCH61997.1 hypothetical protein TBLA_0G00480 [Tetrapisispora blattae CBS 6284]